MTAEYLTAADLIGFHKRLMLEHRQKAVLMSPEHLEAAVMRPQTSVFGEDAYPTLAEKGAALLQSLLIGHPFQDGNKRVAFTAMMVFLRINGVQSRPSDDDLYELILAVAAGVEQSVPDIGSRLRTLSTDLE